MIDLLSWKEGEGFKRQERWCNETREEGESRENHENPDFIGNVLAIRCELSNSLLWPNMLEGQIKNSLLNIMFHAPMGRFQLEIINYFIYFSTVVPSIQQLCVSFPWAFRR